MKSITLKAERRSLIGRKVKKLRREGILPANLYGKKIKSSPLQVKLEDFLKVYKELGETGVVDLVIDGEKKPVLIHNVQFDPVSDTPLHVDFLKVDLKEKVQARIPVLLVGKSPAEEKGLGTVVLYIDEIEVEALPADLPDKFEIDLSKLDAVDQIVTIKDVVSDSSKVQVKADPEQILVKVEPVKEVKEELPAEVPTEKPEEEKEEERAEEGEVPSEQT